MRLLKDDTTPEDLKIYELYLQRSITEGEWIWLRFKIYFSFNAGAFIVIGLTLQPYLKDFLIPFHIRAIATFLCLLGIVFSAFWLMTIRDGKRWQEVMFDTLCRIENHIFKQDTLDAKLLNNMVSERHSGKFFKMYNKGDRIGNIINYLDIKSMDVMVVNSYIATGFFLGWMIVILIVWSRSIFDLLNRIFY